MPNELKLLLLEDNPNDAELIQRLLKRAGIKFQSVVVSDEKEFHAALETNGYHAVLADNALPQYSSMEALELVRETNPHVAFILVTGTVSEEFAVRIIQQGADDYILKTNLTRLPAALINAIDKKRSQKDKEMERELSDSIINSLPGVFYLYDKKGQFLRWNKNLESVSGYSLNEVMKMRPPDFFEPAVKEFVAAWIEKVFSYGYAETEATVLTKAGERIPYLFTGSTIPYGKETCLLGIGVDIRNSKESEKELKQLTEQLRSLSAHLQNVREEEQRRIAREIHDELGQQITGLKMDLSWVMKRIHSNEDHIKMEDHLKHMNKLLDETVVTIRKISSELRPSILDDLGLVAALDWQSIEFEKRYNIPVRFTSKGEVDKLDPATMIGLFRMYQESLTNIARHAAATQVTSSFEAGTLALVLTITDNGKGFDVSKSKQKKTLGLLGMNERVLLMGGTLSIESVPGKGTSVRISVPVGDVDSSSGQH